MWRRLAGRTDGRMDRGSFSGPGGANESGSRRGRRDRGGAARRAAMFAGAAEREIECKKKIIIKGKIITIKKKIKEVFKNANESGTAGQTGPAAPEPGSSLAHA